MMSKYCELQRLYVGGGGWCYPAITRTLTSSFSILRFPDYKTNKSFVTDWLINGRDILIILSHLEFPRAPRLNTISIIIIKDTSYG